MPGLTGFSNSQIDREKGTTILKHMNDYLFHQPFYKRDELFRKDEVYASRVHNNVLQNGCQPVQTEDIYIWMDGEIYDNDINGFGREKTNDAHLLSSLYLEDKEFNFLKNLDGIYSAVIYDKPQGQLHFLTDRYGLKFLYYYKDGQKLAWASEPKAMLALDWFEPKINEDAVHNFLKEAYLIGKQSFFCDVELIPPASILTWDLSGHRFIRNEIYWDWNQVKPLSHQVNVKEVVEEFGSLFRSAVEKRVSDEENMGITISGGLDSRAILAAMPKSEKKIHAFTYGKSKCLDIEIAKQVCKVDGVVHHIVPLNSENWLEKRAGAVWWTDGQMNLRHMHALVLFPQITDFFNINLNGYLAGGIFGGNYLNKKDNFIDKVDNRGRRLINEGTRLKEILGLHNRYPFFDYELIEFILSIPNRYKRNSNLFNKMLMNEFPSYFKNIPWQKTGSVISTTKAGMLFKRKIKGRIKHTFARLKGMIGGDFYDRSRFLHNYPKWLRESSEFVETILKNPEALYPEFTSRDRALKIWQDHLDGADRFDEICSYITFELYLQQVYEKKFRPEISKSFLRT